MSYTIEYFMWGYQRVFLVSAKILAEALFSKLDAHLNPQVFLVGVLDEEGSERHQICIEPEDCGYDPTWFSNVRQVAEHLLALDEEQNMLHSHPNAQERHEKRLETRALKNAILKIVSEKDYYDKRRSFCSWPMKIEHHKVSVVLQLDKEAYDAWYSLQRSELDRMQLPTSLLDAVVWEYFDECQDALLKPDPGLV